MERFYNQPKAIIKHAKLVLIVLVSFYAISSCIDKDFDFQKIDGDMEFNPRLALTIGTINVNMGNFLAGYDSSVLSTDPDGMFRVLYEQELLSYKGDDRITIPAQAPVMLPGLIFPSVFGSNTEYRDSTTKIPINFKDGNTEEGADRQIDSLLVKTMSISVSGTSSFTYDGEMTITLENMKKGNNPFTVRFPIDKAPNGGTSPVEYTSDKELAKDYKMVFENVSDGISEMPITIGLSLFGNPGDPIDSLQNVNLTIVIGDLTYSLMYGYMGQRDIMDITSGMELSFLNQSFAKNIQWANPRLRFFFTNSFSMPIRHYFDDMKVISEINQTTTNATPIGNANPYDIQYPNGPYKAVEDSISLTKTNSPDLYSALEKSPARLEYHLRARINPDGNTGKNNVLMDTSILRGKIVLDLPLHFRTSGVTASDTMPYPFDGEGDMGMSQMLFRIVSENELPFNMLLQMEFVDENYNRVGYAYDNFSATDSTKRFVKAAPIDNNGNTTGASHNVFDIVFNEEKAKQLEKAKNIIITNSLVTNNAFNNNNAPYVKLTDGQKLKMSLAVQIKAKIKTSIDLD